METTSQINTKSNKKRGYMTNELSGKFKSKADFLYYCRIHVSILYVNQTIIDPI